MQTARGGWVIVAALVAGCAGLDVKPPPPPQKPTAASEASASASAMVTAKATTPGVAPARPVLPPSSKLPASPPVGHNTADAPATAQAKPLPSSGQNATKGSGAAIAPLNLTSLEQRLKDTKAIGVFTKITLKNQVDDLLGRFRAFYQGTLKTSLAELRGPFDLLLLKVLSLLQDSDPSLASAIVASREAIWGLLSDPKKFATI